MTPVSSRESNCSLTAVEPRSDRKGGRRSWRDRSEDPSNDIDVHSCFRKRSTNMRAEQATMTSRREFLSDALGIGLVTVSTLPIRTDQAPLIHAQSHSSTRQPH